MAQPEAAAAIREWMEQFAKAAREARVIETSAGAGPEQEFAYLHFHSTDGEHSAVVLRAVLVDGRPQVRVMHIDAGPDRIRDLVDAATHGEVTKQA